MAWTATLTSKSRDAQGRIVAVVQLTDGTVTVTDTYTTDTAPSVSLWLTRLTKDRAAQLDANAAYVASLPAEGSPIDLTVSTAPTAAEVAAATWRTEYAALKQMNQALADGLIASNNPQRTAQITKVKDTFVYPDYLPYLRA